MTPEEIGKLDPAMATKPANTEGVKWYLPFENPMKLLGFNWFDQDKTYERLPIKGRPTQYTRFPNGEKSVIPIKQCGAILLSTHTAGGQIRFRTNSSKYLVSGEVGAPGGMDHMAFTGSAGFDLYLNCNGTWKCFGVTRTDHSVTTFSTTICDGVKREMRDVIINFPLYNSVKSLSIGLDEDAAVEAPTPFEDSRPVVFYGTSITQGGCATRPGMASSNILSRMLGMEVINLGFSGNGRGEPEIAAMLADVKNPGLYLIDYCWNVTPPELEATLPSLLDIIRAKHPTTPIILIAPTPGRFFIEEIRNESFLQKANIMQDEAALRTSKGDAFISFFDALNCSLGDDFWECMVDGAHLTDLGFLRFSEAILPFIKKAIGK